MESKVLTEEQKTAYKNLNINPDHRIIVCLDGGGIRGILTLQLLKKVEEIAGIPLHKFCDLIAGTSTGGIIAGLLASGKTALEIEQLYIELVSKVFLKRNFLANRYVDMPAYDKKNYREALRGVLGNMTLKQATTTTGVDLLITAKDITDNEETFFTCFKNAAGETFGTYQDALLRVVMEATMSAPTYFRPLERFVDGGTTVYNNPSLAALMEAVNYSGTEKYELSKITMFSFGTGKLVKSVSPEDGAKPPGIDVYFWLNYVMDETGQDASSIQNDILRSGLFNIDFRRFQLSLDSSTMKKLPDRDISGIHFSNANWLRDLTDDELKNVDLDAVDKFDLMKEIGAAMVDYIMVDNKFQKDLNNTPKKRDELVTAFENIERIKAIVGSAESVDKKIPSA
jgi:hypothetical protein